jgi:hypothetical protein
MNYREALSLIKGRPSKKLDGNTYLVRVNTDKLAVRLHQTNILTYEPSGRIRLDSGGWQTSTTKDRLNHYLPYGFRIQQISNVWYLIDNKGKKYLFSDGIVIGIKGGLKSAKKHTEKREKKMMGLKRQIKVYVSGFINALFAGKVPRPSGGDCWYCLMKTKEGKTMDEISKSDHIVKHIRQKYYVPSLLMNAIKAYPVSMMANQTLGGIWGYTERIDLADDLAKRQLSSSLRRYIYRNVGLGL